MVVAMEVVASVAASEDSEVVAVVVGAGRDRRWWRGADLSMLSCFAIIIEHTAHGFAADLHVCILTSSLVVGKRNAPHGRIKSIQEHCIGGPHTW